MAIRIFIFAFLLLLISSASFAQRELALEDEMFGMVLGIEGKHGIERGEFVKAQLKRMGVSFFTASFDSLRVMGKDTVNLSGENIVVRLGRGSKRIVVGAHYDCVPESPGANDNGGGVAVLLALVRSLRATQWNYGVDFCFFDREEDGLIGSKMYVRKFVDKPSHLAMVNLDVEGSGNTVYIGPVGGGDDSLIMPLARQAAKLARVPFEERDTYPGSDHRSFEDAKLENISISVVPKGDVDKLVAMAKNGWRVNSEKEMPEVMKVMHTAQDGSQFVTPDALMTSYTFTKKLIELLNAVK
jgi:aminopeptidase-like protein